MKDNYPLLSQSEERIAPWNAKENMPKKVEVTVSITLSKTVEIEVTDYTATEEIDEDNNHNIIYDYSECNLEQAVRDQIPLPNSAWEFNDWDEDDFAVNLEE